MEAALCGNAARPLALRVIHIHPMHGSGEPCFALTPVEFRRKSTAQRQRLYDRWIIAAWDLAHQRAHTAGVIDQRPKILTAPVTPGGVPPHHFSWEAHTSALPSIMRISYAVLPLTKKN